MEGDAIDETLENNDSIDPEWVYIVLSWNINEILMKYQWNINEILMKY